MAQDQENACPRLDTTSIMEHKEACDWLRSDFQIDLQENDEIWLATKEIGEALKEIAEHRRMMNIEGRLCI